MAIGERNVNPATDKYHFETGTYRPPSEGGSASLLVRFTRNCPWNQCTFCGMYKGELFNRRSVPEIKSDIDAMAAVWDDMKALSREMGWAGSLPRQVILALIDRRPDLSHQVGVAALYHWIMAGAKTVFIQDADSLVMKTDDFIEALTYLRRRFPSIERVTTYARAKTLLKKSDAELAAIRQAGLDRLHLGLESGDDELLKIIRKGVTAAELIIAGRKALQAGFQVSEYWMPGLGGAAHWENHARHTARVLNEIAPHYIRSRPFHSWPGTPLTAELEQGRWILLTAREQLQELKIMMTALQAASRVCFDHAANYWKDRQGRLLFTQDYEGYLFPAEKAQVLDRIEEGLLADNAPPALLHM